MLALAALAASALPARAFEWGVFTGLDGGTRDCLLDRLDAGELERLETGDRPANRKLGKKAKAAYRACSCPALPIPYTGVIFDAMAQIDERVDMTRAMERVTAAGVSKIALFARSRKGLGENEDEVLDLARRFPALVVPGAPKYFLLRGDLDAAYVERTVEGVARHGYAFVGEILYTHGDKSHGEQTPDGERYVDPLAPGTARLLARLRRHRVPLMTHWEVYAWERDWPRFDRLYAAWPEQVFIIPHMAFGSPEQVRTLLDRHANLAMTMSKKDSDQDSLSDATKAARLGRAMVDRCRVLKPRWKSLLTAYSGRILFATDAHKPHRWGKYGRYVASGRAILGQLPEAAARAIAHENAERLYGVSVGAK